MGSKLELIASCHLIAKIIGWLPEINFISQKNKQQTMFCIRLYIFFLDDLQELSSLDTVCI